MTVTDSTIVDITANLGALELARFTGSLDVLEMFVAPRLMADACRMLADRAAATLRPEVAAAWLKLAEVWETRIDFHDMTRE